MAHNVKDINHAQFADDTMLLGGAGVHSAKNFKKELDIYLQISGSKIKNSKCIIEKELTKPKYATRHLV